MANPPFVIVGVLKTEEGLKVIDPNQKEHLCVDAESLKVTLERLLVAEDLPRPKTSETQQSHRRRARSARVRDEVDEFEAKVDRVGDGIGEYVRQEYGDTIGGAAGNAVTRGTKGLAGFLRKISR